MSEEIKDLIDRMILREAIRDVQIGGITDYLKYKRQCVFDQRVIPDWFLAVFFGDQFFSPAGVSKINSEATLNQAFNKKRLTDHLKLEYKTYNKINPDLANTIRRTLGRTIDTLFPLGSDIICDQIIDTIKFISLQIKALGLVIPGVGRWYDSLGSDPTSVSAGAAGAMASRPRAGCKDIDPLLQSCYNNVANAEYYNKLNRCTRSCTVPAALFFTFPASASYLSGDPSSLSKGLLNKDLKNLSRKITDLQNIGTRKDAYKNAFNVIFYNNITRTTREAERICGQELKQLEAYFGAPANEASLPVLAKCIIDNFSTLVSRDSTQFKSMLSGLSNASELLQLFSKYRLY